MALDFFVNRPELVRPLEELRADIGLHRSRRSLASQQPSAKALGKRRAHSHSPAPSQAEASPSRSNKRRKVDSEPRNYNLRSRRSGIDDPPTPASATDVNFARKSAASMPKRTSRTKSKVALNMEDDDDVFAPSASTSRQLNDAMDLDQPQLSEEEDDEGAIVIEEGEGMSDEDDEEIDDGDDEDVAEPPATAIIDVRPIPDFSRDLVDPSHRPTQATSPDLLAARKHEKMQRPPKRSLLPPQQLQPRETTRVWAASLLPFAHSPTSWPAFPRDSRSSLPTCATATTPPLASSPCKSCPSFSPCQTRTPWPARSASIRL